MKGIADKTRDSIFPLISIKAMRPVFSRKQAASVGVDGFEPPTLCL